MFIATSYSLSVHDKMATIVRSVFFRQHSNLNGCWLRRCSYARIVDIYSSKETGNTARIKVGCIFLKTKNLKLMDN